MSLIKDVSVYFYEAGGWRLYACATGGNINVSTSVLETSVTGSGKWASFRPQKLSFTGSLDGLVNLDSIDQLTLPDLRAKQIAFENMLMRFQREDKDGNFYTDECNFIITGSSDNHSVDSANGFNISLQGTGEIVQVYTPTPFSPPPPPVYTGVVRYEGTATGGETVMTVPATIGKYVIDVVKDGVGCSGIITAGTPINKEVKFTSGTGDFEFAIAFEPGETFYIIYQI